MKSKPRNEDLKYLAEKKNKNTSSFMFPGRPIHFGCNCLNVNALSLVFFTLEHGKRSLEPDAASRSRLETGTFWLSDQSINWNLIHWQMFHMVIFICELHLFAKTQDVACCRFYIETYRLLTDWDGPIESLSQLCESLAMFLGFAKMNFGQKWNENFTDPVLTNLRIQIQILATWEQLFCVCESCYIRT